MLCRWLARPAPGFLSIPTDLAALEATRLAGLGTECTGAVRRRSVAARLARLEDPGSHALCARSALWLAAGTVLCGMVHRQQLSHYQRQRLDYELRWLRSHCQELAKRMVTPDRARAAAPAAIRSTGSVTMPAGDINAAWRARIRHQTMHRLSC